MHFAPFCVKREVSARKGHFGPFSRGVGKEPSENVPFPGGVKWDVWNGTPPKFRKSKKILDSGKQWKNGKGTARRKNGLSLWPKWRWSPWRAYKRRFDKLANPVEGRKYSGLILSFRYCQEAKLYRYSMSRNFRCLFSFVGYHCQHCIQEWWSQSYHSAKRLWRKGFINSYG